MDTVSKEVVHSWFEGRVVIEKLKVFSDNRGWLTELWRGDDSATCVNPPAMSYFSKTNPFVMRGPHLHSSQTDLFVTMNETMLYRFVCSKTGELHTFLTDKDNSYRISVAPGIIHSYINLNNESSITGNFPDALFMGWEKKEPIDEIRHEEYIEEKPVFVVFGADGRLGKAIIKNLENYSVIYNEDLKSFTHNYTIIPVYEKFKTENELRNYLNPLKSGIRTFNKGPVFVINCSALTDTSITIKNPIDSKYWYFVNAKMPHIIAEWASEFLSYQNIYFSTDYVYKEQYSDLYTHTKKEAERLFRINPVDKTTIFRVANLFSSDANDNMTLPAKLFSKIKNGDEVKANSNIRIYATDVSVIAIVLVQRMLDLFLHPSDTNEFFTESQKFVNLVSDSYTIQELCKEFLETDIEIIPDEKELWYNKYETEGDLIFRMPSSQFGLETLFRNLKGDSYV